MTEPSTLDIIIEKLGHQVEEIRVRALDNVISKLNLGFIKEDEYLLRKKMFMKLLDWFSFNPCPHQTKVLDVMLSLIKDKNGKYLISAVGASKIISKISPLKGGGDAQLCGTILQIEDIVSQNISEERNREESAGLESKPGTFEKGPQLERNEEHLVPGNLWNQHFIGSERKYWSCLQFMQLPWQPLVTSDCHILASVEESLSNMNDPDLVFHTCNFFVDIMLQDFPAEVFLQRPAIVKVFFLHLDGIAPDKNKKICSAILKCLHKLTSALLVRIKFYKDPFMANSKQEGCTSRSLTPSYLTYSSGGITDFSSELMGHQHYEQPSIYERSGAGDYSIPLRTDDAAHKGNDDEDIVVLQFQQMHLPLFCMIALQYAISHRSIHLTLELIKLVNMCVAPVIWTSQNTSVIEIATKATGILQLLGDTIKQHRRAPQTDEDSRLTYLHTLALTRKFLIGVVPLEKADTIIPRNLKCALHCSLLDFSLLCLLPELHRDIVEYCKTFRGNESAERLQHYYDTIKISCSMKFAVNFLKNHDELEGKAMMSLIEQALPSLAFHKTASFVRIVFEECSNKHGRTLDEDDQGIASKVILSLLAHNDPDVKFEMYSLCHKHITSVLGVVHTSTKNRASQVSFLFHVNILTEIICYGVTSENEKISKYSSEMLVHLLKAKIFMSLPSWQMFIEQLIPTMSLLECHAIKTTNLGRTIIAMLDPNTADSLCISRTEILKGNLRLLFATDEYVRNDGMSRLMALVVHEEQSSEKLPQITALHFKTLITYCISESAVDVSVPRCYSSFYEENSMCQVLEVLKDDVTDPRIHRSALSQMAAMLEDTHLHVSFLEQNGIDTCLHIFKRALIEKDYDYYPDSVISIVSILKSLCYQNSKVRLSLSHDYSLYCCILRALFMFGNVRNVRQDIGQLLFLLLYAEYILSIPLGNTNTSVWSPLSLPEIIVKYMNLPFLPRTHWHNSPYIQPSLKGSLLGNEDSHSFLRMSWTCEWFGGVKEILLWNSVKITEQSKYSSALRISEDDLACLKCTTLNHCSKQCLYNIQNGTSHHSVAISMKQMLGYVTLHALLKEKNEIEIQGDWKNMPWESTLIRFFGTAPASSEDEDLLITLLQFLSVCLQHLCPTDIRKPQWSWVYRMLKDPSQPLPGMLKTDSPFSSKTICREVLQLAQDCCRLEHLLDEAENRKNKTDVVSWVYLVFIISQNLKFRDTQHFYNLAFLDWMLTCLSRVTGSSGWTQGYEDHEQLTKDLIWHMVEIIIAFHCNKAGQSSSSAASFMGMSVTRNAIMCLNHILSEMQNRCGNRCWETPWFAALEYDAEGVKLTWLQSLWISRDPLIRCSALQLVAGLVSTQLGSRFLVQGFRECPPDILDVALGFLLDHDEACIVREQAAIILVNMSYHSLPNYPSSSSLSGTADSVTNSGNENLPILSANAFICFLEKKHFFSGIVAMFSGLYLESAMKVGLWPNSSDWSADSISAASQDTDLPLLTASHDDEASFNLTSPNLIKAVCWLLNNVLTFAPDQAVENINKFGLVRILFQSISDVPADTKTKFELLHYVELLEMYISIFTVLAKCVCIDSDCYSTALGLNDCLRNLISLLNPDIYYVHRGDLLRLRNRVWSRLFRLLSCFLSEAVGYEAVLNSVIHTSPVAFASSIENSISSSSSSDLRSNALSTLTLLLSLEIKTQPFHYTRFCNLEDLQTIATEVSSFQSILDWNLTENSETKTAGERLCSVLLNLHEVLSLKHGSGDSKIPSYFSKVSVIGALSSLLSVSHQAKKFALQEGLMENTISLLKELHVHISIEAIDYNLLNPTEKKQINPIFQEVNSLFNLLTNFLYIAPEVKIAAVRAGLADTVHKLWAWCYVMPALLMDTLKMLCTYTSSSVPACHSLVLTTPIVGVTSRKNPTSNSLLHEIIILVIREMELLTKAGDMDVLELAFHLLQNSTHSQECRVILFKSNLFQNLIMICPTLFKKPKQWEMIESMLLPFLLDCTAHTEGQLGLPKVVESMDVIIHLVEHTKSSVGSTALGILRNITFHHLNRPRLLSSALYLQLLSKKLCRGKEEDINLVVQMVWALVANNQKAKLIIKNAGIAHKLQEIYSCAKVAKELSESKINCEMLDYVLQIIFCDC